MTAARDALLAGADAAIRAGRRRGSNAPEWAHELIERVAATNGVGVPDLVWRRSRRSAQSSGRCGANRIAITAGTDRKDAREVVLHEMAHHIESKRRPGNKWHHDTEFYRTLYRLAKEDGRLPATYVMTREAWYRKESLLVAKALGVRGATKALRERKAAVKASARQRYRPCPIGEMCPFRKYEDTTSHTHAEGMSINYEGRWYVVGREPYTDEEGQTWIPAGPWR